MTRLRASFNRAEGPSHSLKSAAVRTFSALVSIRIAVAVVESFPLLVAPILSYCLVFFRIPRLAVVHHVTRPIP